MKSVIEKEKQEVTRPKSSERSSSIVENVKRQKLEEIFQLMDTDEDGIISAQNIEISGLSTEVL